MSVTAVLAAVAAALVAAAVALAVAWRRSAASAREHARVRGELERALDAARAAVARTEESARRESGERSRFLAAASHDLRQPIHAITLFVAALKLQPLDGRPRHLVDHLDRSLAGLDELFNRLLDIARLDGGAIVPQPREIGIASLLRPLGPRFEGLAAERGLRYRLRAGPDDRVLTDPALLVEIVMNLLSNAFRYTPRGGVLLAARRRGGHVRIEVWDTGVGIAPDQQARVFDEFVQLGNPSRDRRRGVGLGLAIVRRIADRLGHRVELRSRPGRGTVVSVDVPIVRRAGRDAPAAEAPAPRVDLGGLLVLAVDDEIEVLVATEALLRGWGCLVLLARSVAEAARWLESSERFPDVVITDHRLAGGGTSTELIGALAAAMPEPPPVLVVSAEAEGALGADPRAGAVLAKPVDPQRLREALETLATRAGWRG